MADDEAAIRNLADRWRVATQTGDGATVLTLMTDDVVFQVPGKAPFGKARFKAMSAPSSGGVRPGIDPEQTILELPVLGDIACGRSALRVRKSQPNGQTAERGATTLTISRKVSGHW